MVRRIVVVAVIGLLVTAGLPPAGAVQGSLDPAAAPSMCLGSGGGGGGSVGGSWPPNPNNRFIYTWVNTTVPAGGTLQASLSGFHRGDAFGARVRAEDLSGKRLGGAQWLNVEGEGENGPFSFANKKVYTNRTGSSQSIRVGLSIQLIFSRRLRANATLSVVGAPVSCSSPSDRAIARNLGRPATASFAADPVHVGTGNFTHGATDMASPPGVFGGGFSRTYNSLDDGSVFDGETDPVLGLGWTTPLDVSFRKAEAGRGARELRLEDGGRHLFESDGAGGFVLPPELFVDEVLFDAGSDPSVVDDEWTVIFKSGERMRFDFLGSILERDNGQGQRVLYDRVPQFGRVAKARAESQVGGVFVPAYELNFAYSPVAPRLLERVTGPDGAMVDYGYTANQLTSVSAPYFAGETPQPMETYVLDPQTSLISEVLRHTSTGVVSEVVNTFDGFRRVETQQLPDGDTVTFTYGFLAGPNTRTTTVNHDGVVGEDETTTYVHDPEGRLVFATDSLGGSVDKSWTDPLTQDVTELLYDFGDREGADFGFAFDALGRPVQRVTPDPSSGEIGERTVGTGFFPAPSSSDGWGLETFVYCDTDPNDVRLRKTTSPEGETVDYLYGDPLLSEDLCLAGQLLPKKVVTAAGTPAESIQTISSSDGLIDSVTDGDGVTTSFVWDSAKRQLLSQAVSGGPTTAFAYDPAGRVKTVTEAAGTAEEAVTIHDYDAAGRLLKVTDALVGIGGRQPTEHRYDATGRLLWTSDASNPDSDGPAADGGTDGFEPTLAYTYRADGKIETETRLVGLGIESGATTVTNRYSYGAAGRITSITEADGTPDAATTSYVYGNLGRLESVTDPAGVIAQFCYDRNGNRTDVVIDQTAVNCSTLTHTPGALQHVRTDYDALGRITAEVNAEGERTETFYDKVGRPTKTIEAAASPDARESRLTYDAAGRLETTTGQAGGGGGPVYDDIVEERQYTPGGRVDRVCTPPSEAAATYGGGGCGGLNAAVTSFAYDAAGRQILVTDPSGQSRAFEYDPAGRLATQVTAPGDPKFESRTSFAYDLLGRRTRVTRPSPNGYNVSSLTAYTPLGQVASDTDFAQDPTAIAAPTFVYNDAQWLLSVTDAVGHTVSYTYDARGNRTRRQSTQNGTDQLVEIWEYDAADRLTAEIEAHPLATTPPAGTTYGYGPLPGSDYGRLTSVSDPSGRVSSVAYDQVGRTTQETFTGPATTGTATVDTSYDALGRPEIITRSEGATVEVMNYAYDAAGNFAVVDGPRGDEGFGFDADRLDYEWSVTGNVLLMHYPDGKDFRYRYFRNGLLKQTLLEVDPGVFLPIGTYQYTPSLLLRKEKMDNGKIAVRSWFYARNGAPDPIFYQQDFKPDTDDDLETTISYHDDGRIASDCDWTNVKHGRQGRECIGSTTSYAYDPAGQLTDISANGVLDETVAYDDWGNRTTYTDRDPDDDPATSDDPTLDLYAVTSAGELNTVTHQSDPGSGFATDSVDTYTHDDAGRRLSLVNDPTGPAGPDPVFDYTYNNQGQIVSLDDGIDPESYGYDPAGNFTSRTDSNSDSKLLWDPAHGISRRVGASDIFTPNIFIAFGLRPLYVDTFGVWISLDYQGSAIQSTPVTDLGVDIADSFDAWGNPEGIDAEPLDEVPGYRSEWQLGDRIHLRNRDYDPTTGTFLTRDPLDGIDGTPTVASAYHYVDNDPLNRSDPLGLRSEDHVWVACGTQCGGKPREENVPLPPTAPSPDVSPTSPCENNRIRAHKLPGFSDLQDELDLRSASGCDMDKVRIVWNDTWRNWATGSVSLAANSFTVDRFLLAWDEVEEQAAVNQTVEGQSIWDWAEDSGIRFLKGLAVGGLVSWATSSVVGWSVCTGAFLFCFSLISAAFVLGTLANYYWVQDGEGTLLEAASDTALSMLAGHACKVLAGSGCLGAYLKKPTAASPSFIGGDAGLIESIWLSKKIWDEAVPSG